MAELTDLAGGHVEEAGGLGLLDRNVDRAEPRAVLAGERFEVAAGIDDGRALLTPLVTKPRRSALVAELTSQTAYVNDLGCPFFSRLAGKFAPATPRTRWLLRCRT